MMHQWLNISWLFGPADQLLSFIAPFLSVNLKTRVPPDSAAVMEAVQELWHLAAAAHVVVGSRPSVVLRGRG